MPSTRTPLGRPSLGGLLATRRGAFALALLCALAAAGILLFATEKYRHVSTGPAKQDTVLVATAEIHKGASADIIASQRLYEVTPILASQVAPGAIVDAASLVGKIAATDILPGQQLKAADFAVPDGSVLSDLTPGERAVSVSMDPQHGLADVLQTGDHVDVYGSFSIPPGLPVVSLLVANAVVLKAPNPASGGGSSSGTVLLGISTALSPRVMWVADNGKVWLVLRGFGAVSPTPTITGLRAVVLGNHLSTSPTIPSPSPSRSKR